MVEIIIIFTISSYITYYLVEVIGFNWIQMFLAITGLMVGSGYLIQWLTPVQLIMDMIQDIKKITIFNVSIFGGTNLFISWYLLYKHFGWQKAATIGLGSPVAAGLITAAIQYARHA